MILPPDVEFHEDIRLFVWRPRGLLNRAAVNRIITVVGELETTFKEPFNRFTDTVAAGAVDLNFEYMIRVSLHRRRSYAGRPPVKSAYSKSARKPRDGSAYQLNGWWADTAGREPP